MRAQGIKEGNLYYDREGQAISLRTWMERFADRAYRRVAETRLPNGLYISTVWLGLDHAFFAGPPLIFETMVFANDQNFADLDSLRYTTEQQAQHGHQQMVRKWKAKNLRSQTTQGERT